MFPISDDMKIVDDFIRKRINSKIILIQTIGEYLIKMGGKRIRPAIMLMIARSLNYQGSSYCLTAAVIEFIHTATLLHDDVVDDSDLRRGQISVNNIFGNAASVLVGDYLYSLAFEVMVSIGSMKIMNIFSKATTTIAEGEILQLLNMKDPEVSFEKYLQVVKCKTAKLFEVSAQVGAILSSASPKEEEAASSYGRHIGTAFQLIDDVLDYEGEVKTLGKNIGKDLKEGKPTLPLIRVLNVGSSKQKQLVRNAIQTGNADPEAIIKAIRETDALEYTIEMAKLETSLAQESISFYPDSIYKESLMKLCFFATDRSF